MPLDVVRILAWQQSDVEGDDAPVGHLVVLGAAGDRADVEDRSARKQWMRFVRQGRFQLAQPGKDRLHRLDRIHADRQCHSGHARDGICFDLGRRAHPCMRSSSVNQTLIST